MIEMIALDADDTLWQAEVVYQNAQLVLQKSLSRWESPENIDRFLLATEKRNLPAYGYGVKSFVLSMIEAAIEVSDGQIGAESITEILSIGRAMFQAEMVLLPEVPETLETLSANYPLMVITKGDLLDQTGKLEQSGLAGYFTQVEVVSEKSLGTYQALLEKHQINPSGFVMVGNSLKSDILPVLELGATAVHIPAETTWELEAVSEFTPPDSRFYELKHMGALPKLITTLARSA